MKVVIIAIIIVGLTLSSGWAWAHGGKTHAEQQFTALAALQKGVELYNRLLAAGKLDVSWEAELAQATVSKRKRNGKMEWQVAFSRQKGDPRTVFFFLDETGRYTASNFGGE